MLEPSTKEQTLQILKNLRACYEAHHGVSYTDKALEACVDLTERYVTDRFFPDKAIDAMDETGSYARLTRNSVSKEIKEKETEIENLKEQKTKRQTTKTTNWRHACGMPLPTARRNSNA